MYKHYKQLADSLTVLAFADDGFDVLGQTESVVYLEVPVVNNVLDDLLHIEV